MAPNMLMLVELLGAHALFDFVLQGEFIALGKNRYKPTPLVPWYHAMLAHVTLHGAAVAIITGIWWLFIVEAVIHFITDDLKCANKISTDTDQWIHLVCKFIWWGMVPWVVYPL